MFTRKFALTGILLLLIFPVFAQQAQDSTAANPETESPATEALAPFQVTLVSPLGTNGAKSTQAVNLFSLNLIAGYNGGLEGLEIGGFANALSQNARGSQIAGFGNLVMGNLEGIQIAGFGNLVNGTTSGIQIAGFSNTGRQSSQVIQIGGFCNFLTGTTKGGQIAGFVNHSSDTLKGMQIAGFGNVAGSEVKGAQISGFGNVAGKDVKGGQISGFGNRAENVEGVQISGFLNRAENVKGAQVAGFINRADTVDGVQIGLINRADTFTSGCPIGLISNVKDGYRSISVGVNELQWVEGQLHLGLPLFYNILSLGIGPVPGSESWAYGYGIGSKVLNRERSKIALEAMVYGVNEREIWNGVNNMLIRFQPKYEFHPKRGDFGLWVGPSLNMLISGRWDSQGDSFTSELAPYTLLDDQSRYNNYDFWAGAQIGIQF